MSDSPNLLRAGLSIVRSLISTRRPKPSGSGVSDHSLLSQALDAVSRNDLATAIPALSDYIDKQAAENPDNLTRDEALAYWINLYNAGGLLKAAEASRTGASSLFRVPGAFTRPFVMVSGENLSLDAIEHGKVRRFGDPRIHAALVCGAVSCPTLRPEPYEGDALEQQLEEQMRGFMETAASIDQASGAVGLSMILAWYGADFVRPARMPALLPAGRSAVLEAVRRWLPNDFPTTPPSRIRFMPYDWGLRCSVG